MKLSDRDKIALFLAPLAIVLGGYVAWFNVFERPKVQAAASEHEAAVAAQASPEAILQQQLRGGSLNRVIETLTKNKTRLEALAAAAAGHDADPVRRMEAEKAFGSLLRRHGLEVVEECMPGQAEQGKLPGSLAEALGRFGKPAAPQAVQVRRLRLSGSFMGVLAAIRELAALDVPPSVPISLSMSEADSQDGHRTWTLVVMM
jgi:hypothetical protein